ncbi:hypothetical protein ACLOJK_035319 [Asimina triloba]
MALHATIQPSVVIINPHSFLRTPVFLDTAMMALRAVAAATPPPPLPTFSSAPKLSPPTPPPKSTPPPKTPLLKQTIFLSTSSAAPAAVSLLLFLSSSADAKALGFSKEQVVSSLTEVENAINQAVGVGSGVLDFSKGVFQTVFEVLKPGIDVALPIIQKAGGKAVEITSPAISGAANKAKESLQSAGFDPQPVVSAAKSIVGAAPKVIEKAKPVASTTIETLLSSDPRTIAVAGGALFLSYLLLPPIWSVISFNLRGYQGDLSPAQALHMISSQNHLIIDIRSEKDKNKAGIPRPPNDVRNKIISIPLEEIPSKVKNLVRNVKKVEAEIVALKISYLKRVNKGSNLVIMDSFEEFYPSSSLELSDMLTQQKLWLKHLQALVSRTVGSWLAGFLEVEGGHKAA